MRKVVQISSVAAPCEPTAHDAFCEVFALCDDGAVFNGFWKVGVFEWKQLPPIPQPEIAELQNLSNSGLDNICPICQREKARSAKDCADGKCSHWWAVRDEGAKSEFLSWLANKADEVVIEAVEDFETWWEKKGQFCRSGGGEYEKTFAFRAWERSKELAENKPEIADEVVMPKAGDAIFVADTDGILDGSVTILSKINESHLTSDNGMTWSYWKLNLSAPWRDATGKIVEV